MLFILFMGTGDIDFYLKSKKSSCVEFELLKKKEAKQILTLKIGFAVYKSSMLINKYT